MATILVYRHNPRLLKKQYTQEQVEQALREVGFSHPGVIWVFKDIFPDDPELTFDESNELHMAIKEQINLQNKK